ncbi:acetylornithine deacetylase [Alkalihalobacillus alcalophilus ATCC 27647 = CGMCC 1.3604]|uniref:Acetylornithine deacetylase n=1 Tax=Alkalihalobacillus alcalophilus ATCC 27647 = CGMCC 1.3604 TaxID=1218173 RepID=A0A094WF75_ALKAL|nr:acetylornithine deacetylase [Alkalihalobacillus alcalophilus]KGA96409.1 acetylornithine deacetylase [Alkalihalobacillus alcalophilus ATCC 27647 = CGMCC 1.3604]MED1560471.1 acetylornithine deacetylase [Alkalihalobacillus alcalophilus]THG90862.1 acetylornithine deacetylase [Alkalihalobacillus alcalophilus ATCC 27647 = CGMCC 1.3604]
MESNLLELLELVDSRQDELVDLLSLLIRYKTPAPPARNTEEVQQFIADFLNKKGFMIDKWDVYPGDPNVVGVLKGKRSDEYQSLIVNGHVDVAEVSETEEWEVDPFTPIVKDGVVIGRGAADMKGGMAGALFAIQLMHEAGIDLPGDLIFQSVIGEEVGEAGTLECCKRGYKADFALVVDTSNLQIQGQGGVITGWITVKSKQTHHDATRKNMIHAGGQLFGASAIEKMMKVIQGLQDLERHWSVMKSYPGYDPGTNTINPAVIEGGRHAAFIADECRLWITVHFYPNETHEQVAKEIEEHIQLVAKADPWLRENPPTFEWGGSSMIVDRGEIFPSLEVDPEHQAVKTLSGCHESTLYEQPVIGVSPTVTDGGWFGDAGIPAAIYGPGELKHAHSINEQVSIQQLVDYTKVVLRFMFEWCHTKK